jgi:YYY domain-containing protein
MAALSPILLWYLAIFALGLLAFPFLFSLLPALRDRGWGVSRSMGLLAAGYLVWVGGSFRIVPYSATAVLAALIVIFPISAAVAFRERAALRDFFKASWRTVILIEGLAAVVFALFSLLRAFQPDITGGLAEKKADFMMVNSILRSDSFPPHDAWFSGAPINYYYFGYLLWTIPMRLTGIKPSIGYNLAIASVAMLSALGAYAFSLSLVRKRVLSLLAPAALLIASNLKGAAQVLHGSGLAGFDWWAPSREILPGTINEFPFFSFLLGDLHAHLMDIPFVLLLLVVLSAFVLAGSGPVPSFRDGGVGRSVSSAFLAALVLGAVAFVNSWDFPAAFCLTGAAIFLMAAPAWAGAMRAAARMKALARTGAVVAVIWLGSLGLYAGFYRNFKSQFSQAVTVPAARRSPLGGFLMLFLPFLAITILLLYREARKALAGPARGRSPFFVATGSFVLLFLWFLSGSLAASLVTVVAAGLVLFLTLRLRGDAPEERAEAFLLLSLAAAFLILSAAEFVAVKDFYGDTLLRQNTVFKFHYLAWILLAAATPGVVARLRPLRWFSAVPLLALAAASLVYAPMATLKVCGRFGEPGRELPAWVPTLDGTAFLRTQHPDDTLAIEWIEKNLKDSDTILEATGEPYSYYGRVSATTGISTVLGWGNHEALWRDASWKTITERTADIDSVYRAPDKTAVRPLLEKYGVDYIYVGEQEIRRYGHAGMAGFRTAFRTVYENRRVRIFKVSG